MKGAYTVISLFAGIGGIDLGFERAGFKVLCQVEIDAWCRRVLAKYFPDAERFDDVRTVGLHNLPSVDVIVGGFPCQDISYAGNGAGIEGERSGLWKHYFRIVRELRPRIVFVENVSALLRRGLDVVLGDLASIGYDCEWRVISAAEMGAPHLRERVWIVAYSRGIRYIGPSTPYAAALDEERNNSPYRFIRRAIADTPISGSEDVSDSNGHRSQIREHVPGTSEAEDGIVYSGSEAFGVLEQGKNVAYSTSERCGETRRFRLHEPSQRIASSCEEMANSECLGRGQMEQSIHAGEAEEGIAGSFKYSSIPTGRSGWEVEPAVGRVADGIPHRVDRLRGLGNAVVPQIPELFAHRIRQGLDTAVQEETR